MLYHLLNAIDITCITLDGEDVVGSELLINQSLSRLLVERIVDCHFAAQLDVGDGRGPANALSAA